ncbi:arylsulfatase [Lentisphaera profundi]|uniref:Arylsulfatase n=1 Tax=Lentisphaera profundi TaxID=1658616 RepID=A0ABY7VW86_9BACT|nr:arylsulfatase [Lentisphaera profundi]WDE97152.1 arylsulfatase [Lentisphaera profundi]
MNKMIIAIGLCVLSSLSDYALANEGERPNIIIILADDLGYGDCGAFNPQSKIKTPHIDQLAEEGMSFTDAHSASTTCTPSRYGLLTGTNPCRTGVLNTLLKTGHPIIDADEYTVADFLKSQNYQTHMVGKWHLGFEMDKTKNKKAFDLSQDLLGGPVDCGFDYFYGVHSSVSASPMFYIKNRQAIGRPEVIVEADKINGSGKKSKFKIQLAQGMALENISPDLCADAVRLIKEYAKSDQEQPFFLYYASTIPHQPWVPSAEFKGKSGLGVYADFVMQFDDEVGQINQALKDTGLDNNTILIFTSDNGPGPGASRNMEEQGHGSTGILRGMKSDAWEGGHRVPFIAKWPHRIKAGTQNQAIINATDLFATFAALLKVNLARLSPHAAPDSVSFLETLLDADKKFKRPAMINGRHAIRKGDWKLVSIAKHSDAAKLKPSDFKLFNLAEDISEKSELTQENPERLSELYKEFIDFANERKLK